MRYPFNEQGIINYTDTARTCVDGAHDRAKALGHTEIASKLAEARKLIGEANGLAWKVRDEARATNKETQTA